MRAVVIAQGSTSLEGLKLVERPIPEPGPGEVVIRVRACSLNYRDQAVVTGNYFGGPVARDLIPLSDGAGEIAAVGAGVTRFKEGDRVASTFFPEFIDGPPGPDSGPALGANPTDGTLAEYIVQPASGVIHMAKTLSFEEAATLPCAGVTAWNALMEGRKSVRPGAKVLVLGTGGVSLIALQIAKAAGAEVTATSSSDEKLARVKALGATHGVNYKAVENWGPAAAELAGRGFDHVVEVGGIGTLMQSFLAVGYAGEVALIGVLTREGSPNPHALMTKGASLRGIFVGNRAMAERLNEAVDANGIKPVIDKVFPLEQVAEAYRYQAGPDLFGKVVITL